MCRRTPAVLRRRGGALFLVFAVVAATPACSGEGADGTRRRLSIATGGTGGVYYPYGGGVAKIISENIEGVEATAEVTAASVDNLKFLRDGRSDLAFTMADTLSDAAQARGVFAEFGAVPARALAVLYPNYTHLVTRAESTIRTTADLRGKVVSTGAAGSGTEVVAFRLLEAAGLDRARDLRTQALGVAQSADALKDGKLDAFFWNGGLPTAAVLDLAHSPGLQIRLVPTDNLLPALTAQHGTSLYYRQVIPKSAYRLSEDVPVVAVANLLVASEALPEPLAYDITRVMFEKQGVLAGIHPQARELSLSSAVEGSPVPFHPGAIRYYRERGVWTR
jgi:TRAP transporter TAXI family solute receptor